MELSLINRVILGIVFLVSSIAFGLTATLKKEKAICIVAWVFTFACLFLGVFILVGRGV